ncbi:protein of unknown function [Nitrospira japonica]|uniref:Uncharacterized protein n=1 Tax=Nitrospira japonica TaxID=1325564 RepID=A0A1W1I429_9BACT|nr:protein of unknown function [Nitrospira japonica]
MKQLTRCLDLVIGPMRGTQSGSLHKDRIEPASRDKLSTMS